MSKQIVFSGTQQEGKVFTDVIRHYDLAKEDLDQRIKSFDKVDELFRSHIDESGWPYQSLIFDPRTFTSIFEKTSRLFANKPRGRLIPREGGDSLGAMISNQLLNFQWDDNERADGMPMLAKWSLMDMNARKYGASFALVKWRYERKIQRKVKGKQDEIKSVPLFDGPNFQPLINRDCLANPAYSSVRHWFQHRDYVTLQELETVNDAARGKPVYKNLDILRDKVREDSRGGDTRAANYVSKNLSIKNLQDYLGRDEVLKFKTIEIVTEYRDDRWISFAPKHGVILRDIPNPYDHGQLPIVMLKYYPVDDDLYGLSEIEPIEKLQRAVNALWSQYVDSINMSLYSPLKVKSRGVEMHTLEFGPGKKWLMEDPSNVVPYDQSPTGVSEFATTYRLLIGALQEGLGEASQGVSGLSPGESDKTATEIVDSARQRLSRDNFNQMFLAEALKKQMMFWHKMNAQYLFNDPVERVKVVRIVGKEAIRYFEKAGLGGTSVSDEAMEMLSSPEFEGMGISPEELATDTFPVKTKDGKVPKFVLEPMGDMGHLLIEPGDLAGTYDYIADIESMTQPNQAQLLATQQRLLQIAQAPVVQQSLANEGFKIKVKELLEDFFEKSGLKDADKYFEKAESNENEQTLGGGIQGLGGSQVTQGFNQPQGVEGNTSTIAGIQG